MQNGHLREHAIASLMDHNTSGAIQNFFTNDNSAAHRQAVHEATIFLCVLEPGVVNTPVIELRSGVLILGAVSVVLRR